MVKSLIALHSSVLTLGFTIMRPAPLRVKRAQNIRPKLLPTQIRKFTSDVQGPKLLFVLSF